jgi:diguanylate cyclase (GGDEF)-like protein
VTQDLASEVARLAELASYRIVDSGPDAAFDALAQAAALVAGTPAAAIGLVDRDRDWFKATVGMDVEELPREVAFCDHVVRERQPVIVDDTAADVRFAANPLVVAEDGVRFYAGFPLRTPTGEVLGSLCVTDNRPRSLDPSVVRVLWTLADQAMAQIELRRQAADAYTARDESKRRELLLDAVLDSIDVGIVVCDADGTPIADNACNREVYEWSVAESDGSAADPAQLTITDRSGRPLLPEERPIARTLREGAYDGMEIIVQRPDGAPRWIRLHSRLLLAADGTRLGAMLASHDESEAVARERELSGRLLDVERLAETSRMILAGEDPARVACASLKRLTEAQQVTVLMPNEGGELVVVATTEPSLADIVVPSGADSLANDVFRSLTPTMVDVVLGNSQPYGGATRTIRAAHGTARTAMYRPLLHDGQCAGVLIVSLDAARDEIPARTERLVAIVVDELSLSLERDRLRQVLAEQATTDPLTGLANRRVWDERLAAQAKESGPVPTSLAILDLDHFKAYNDENGHPAGDELLRMAAAAWSGALRGQDLLARIGGEEFGILLYGCSVTDAVVVLDKLRARVPYGESASIGLAEQRAGESPLEWSARADRALYRAKSEGRDRLVVDDGDFLDRRGIRVPEQATVTAIRA